MIAALIVTYNPEHNRLKRLLDVLLPQVDSVIIVDNGSHVPVEVWLNEYDNAKIIWLPLGKNRGIATAHNEGIRRAQALNANYILLLDHDSIPASDMVSQLLAVMHEREASGEKIGIVGPRFVDSHITEHLQPPHFVRLVGCRFYRIACSSELAKPVAVDFLIASGSLVPLSVFDEVGVMNERLFIDHVDTEFSFRLKKAGYSCYGIPLAVMEHEIGDESHRIFTYNAPMHSPLRHYYIVRNAVWIIRQPWMKVEWKIALGVNTLRRFTFYSLFALPRWKHFTMMLRGLWHGLRGRLGQFPCRGGL